MATIPGSGTARQDHTDSKAQRCHCGQCGRISNVYPMEAPPRGNGLWLETRGEYVIIGFTIVRVHGGSGIAFRNREAFEEEEKPIPNSPVRAVLPVSTPPSLPQSGRTVP